MTHVRKGRTAKRIRQAAAQARLDASQANPPADRLLAAIFGIEAK
jgi:hypothetical protein